MPFRARLPPVLRARLPPVPLGIAADRPAERRPAPDQPDAATWRRTSMSPDVMPARPPHAPWRGCRTTCRNPARPETLAKPRPPRTGLRAPVRRRPPPAPRTHRPPPHDSSWHTRGERSRPTAWPAPPGCQAAGTPRRPAAHRERSLGTPPLAPLCLPPHLPPRLRQLRPDSCGARQAPQAREWRTLHNRGFLAEATLTCVR